MGRREKRRVGGEGVGGGREGSGYRGREEEEGGEERDVLELKKVRGRGWGGVGERRGGGCGWG